MSRRVGGREATTGVIPGRYCLSVGKPDFPAPEGWSWKPLLEMARLESGHTPSRRKPEYWGGDVSWIGIKDATANHGQTIHQTIQHTNALGIANSAARILPKYTVCLSRTASVGYVVVMGKPMATSQDFANWVCAPELDYRFLKYALVAENETLHRFSYGSTHRTIYYPELKAFHVCVPDKESQEEIADVLQALDDKIELNRKTSATLEEMARALYRSWFVDFDPVHAKAAGRAPAHMDAQTASLFPDRFGEDGLPEGWKWQPVSEVCEHVKQTVKPMAQADQLFHHFSLPAFDATRVPATEHGNEIKSNKLFVPNNAILFSRLNPSIPRVWWAQTDEETAIPAASTEFFIAKAFQDFQTPWLYCLMSSAGFRDEALFRVTGTSSSHQRVPPTTFAEIEVIKPTDDILHAFFDICGKWFERIHAMSKENQTLAALRDTLLPRLMSGELRVGEAREQAEERA